MKNVHPNTTLGRDLCKDTALWRVEMPFGGSLESHHCCSFSLVPTYSSQPLSAAGVPAQAAVVQESCEELGSRRARKGGEGKMWRGVRAGGSSQQPERDLRKSSALCPHQCCWSLTICMVFSGPCKAGGPATETDHVLLDTICSASVFSQGFGQFF